MADVISHPHHQPQSPPQLVQPRPMDISSTALRISTPPQSLPTTASNNTLRSGQLHLDTFSPINQNGAFEFDRVIKSGTVLKRTRKTKAWKRIHLVLRPNLLSIYRDDQETKLRHQITLSDLTAVARQKDPKGKAKHTFGLFTPSRNYHIQADSDKDAQEWVELVRREARIDEGEEDMIIISPDGARNTYQGFERHPGQSQSNRQLHDNHTGYSSSDAEPPRRSHPSTQMHSARRGSHYLDYSGNELASYSDFSDSAAGVAGRMSNLSLALTDTPSAPSAAQPSTVYGGSPRPAFAARSSSQMSGLNNAVESKVIPKQDEERVICHGWMLLLKSRSGMRQWKRVWVVLRPKTLALYKNEDEYSALLIMPFHTIVNAVEIDPVSRSKRYCLQIISEERNYRFCAPDDDALAKWLGAFKSLLVKRKEMEMQMDALKKQSQGQSQGQGQQQ